MKGSYSTYLEALRSRLQGVKWESYGKTADGPLVCFSTPGKERCLYVTGIAHSETHLGPATFVKHGQVLVDMAKASGVGLRVYPFVNPSSIRPASFFEYETAEGEWAKELDGASHYKDMRIRKDLPLDAAKLAADLALRPVPKAMLSIGQWKSEEPLAYAFVSGEFAPYRALSRASSRFAKANANADVPGAHSQVKTDRDGLAPIRNDGSLQDYFTRQGTKYAAVLETGTACSVKNAMGTHLVWLMGFVELAAR